MRSMCSAFLGVISTFALLLGGCSQTHPSDDIAGGIYDLDVARELDACSPLRAIGSMGPVAVIVEDGAIDVPVPELGDSVLTAPRIVLRSSSFFHSEMNRQIPGCEGAWVHEEWTVVETDGSSFDLLHTQRWEGLASCADASAHMPGAPSLDCVSERRLRYDLTEVCAAPCRLRLGEGSSLFCFCG